MRIHVTRTTPGSEDGNHVITYEAGQEYDMNKRLGGVFVAEGWGEEVEAGEGDDTEQKDAGAASENKDAGPAPKNKRRKAK